MLTVYRSKYGTTHTKEEWLNIGEQMYKEMGLSTPRNLWSGLVVHNRLQKSVVVTTTPPIPPYSLELETPL